MYNTIEEIIKPCTGVFDLLVNKSQILSKNVFLIITKILFHMKLKFTNLGNAKKFINRFYEFNTNLVKIWDLVSTIYLRILGLAYFKCNK